MNNRTIAIRPIVAAAGLTVLVAGCGSSESSTASNGSAQSSSTSAAATSLSSGTSPSGSADPTGDGRASLVAKADLLDKSGTQVGTVDFAVDGTAVIVTAEVEGLPAGFKGFHVHAIGKCEPNSPNPADPSKVGDFLSAGGHLGGSSAAHPGHDGDLTSLQVRADGTAELVTTTDNFDVDALLDEDGSAVMVHAGPDDFGNIPTRYAPGGPDAETQATGDSGGRAACGVVEPIAG